MPQRPFTSPAFVQHVREQARHHGLKWYVELGPSLGAGRMERREVDGYFLRHLKALNGALMRRTSQLLVAVRAEDLNEGKGCPLDGGRSLLDPERVTLVLTECGNSPRPVLMRDLERWGCPVGYSDTQPDWWPALASVMVGARVVVKGLTLNRSLGGPTHRGGLYPHEFSWMVERIRQHESLLRGQPWADGSASSRAEEALVDETESLVAARPLRAGDVLTSEDLKRVPGLRGVSAATGPRLIGARLLYDRQPDEPLTFGVMEPLSSRAVGSPLDISVVIRTKDESRWLRRCLSALAHQQRPPNEIIVVDNNSSDDTVAIASSFGCQIFTIHDHEFSFGRALNRGIDATSSPWIISLSAHCIPLHDRWLAAFARERPSPFVAAVYGKQEPLPDTSDFDKRDLWTTFGEEGRVQQGQDYFFHNANSMIRREAWERIPFDETLTGVEDRDWAKKALADGFQIVYAPLASVHHYHGIHQGRNEARAKRVVKVIELIQQREPAESPAR
jgi:GT2 family glycosyltransferase